MTCDYLKGKTVYLSGSMHDSEDDGLGWRENITPILEDRWGLNIEDPGKKTAKGVCEVKDDKARFIRLVKEKAFRQVKKEFWPIVRKDLRAVDISDFVIVYYDPTKHMCGTIHELVVAHQQRKPILLKYNLEHAEKLNPWIFTFMKSDWVFDNWDDLYSHLDAVNDGRYDEDYWTL